MRILFADGTGWAVDEPRAGHGGVAGGVADGALLAPMPGKIIAVDVAEGDHVTKGQRLIGMEAMKMEQSIIAPFDGRDQKRVGMGKRVSVRVDLGGRRLIKKKNNN